MDSPHIELDPTFAPEHEALFGWLLANVVWDETMRSRKTASFGLPYDYSGIHYPRVPMPACLVGLAERLRPRLGYTPNNCLVNFYETGERSMGFHSDSQASVVPGTDVSIVSLGATRTLRFKHKTSRLQCDYALSPGSLVVMRPASQEDWLHALPPEPGAGPRISVTFRLLADPGFSPEGTAL